MTSHGSDSRDCRTYACYDDRRIALLRRPRRPPRFPDSGEPQVWQPQPMTWSRLRLAALVFAVTVLQSACAANSSGSYEAANTPAATASSERTIPPQLSAALDNVAPPLGPDDERYPTSPVVIAAHGEEAGGWQFMVWHAEMGAPHCYSTVASPTALTAAQNPHSKSGSTCSIAG